MNKPAYKTDEVYTELENICELAGLNVTYGKVKRGAVACSNYEKIFMPEVVTGAYDYCEQEMSPGEVLGHEVGHCLLERGSSPIYKNFMQLLPEKERNVIYDEVICDFIGEVLYSLSELIALNCMNVKE